MKLLRPRNDRGRRENIGCFCCMSRRLLSDAASFLVDRRRTQGRSGCIVSLSLTASALTRATALVRLRFDALLSTLDRAFAPRAVRMLPRANRGGAAMRLGTGAGALRRRALIPGSREGQCGPHSGPQNQCVIAPPKRSRVLLLSLFYLCQCRAFDCCATQRRLELCRLAAAVRVRVAHPLLPPFARLARRARC